MSQHPQMQVKTLPCKEESIYKQVQKCSAFSGPKLIEDGQAKWKTVLWSDELKCMITFGNHGRHVLWTKQEGPSSFLSARSSKASIRDGMGVH